MVEFSGETFRALCSDKGSEIHIDGKRFDILPKTLLKFKNCSNSREYIEAIEFFAYQVLVSKEVSNDDYFKLKE